MDALIKILKLIIWSGCLFFLAIILWLADFSGKGERLRYARANRAKLDLARTQADLIGILGKPDQVKRMEGFRTPKDSVDIWLYDGPFLSSEALVFEIKDGTIVR